MKKLQRLLILFALSPVIVLAGGNPMDSTSESPRRVPGQIIVRFKSIDAMGLPSDAGETQDKEWRRSPSKLEGPCNVTNS